MRIITLIREFGSGGRELGKRLADYLNFAYYDREIITAIAQQGNLLLLQQKILKELSAKGDCIVVGRGADVILEHCNPFNLFVYADMEVKIERCSEYAKI